MVRILLQCKDSYFVHSFSNYVSANCPELEFLCYTNEEQANTFIKSSGKKLEAVISEEDFLEELDLKDTLKLYISDRTLFSKDEAIRLNIYQPGNAIIADIKSALSLKKGYLTTATGKTVSNLTAVFSYQGGSGKTVLGYALALAAVKEGKQALYLNLEPIPYTGQLYHHTFQSSMDDMLFALKDGRELAAIMMDTIERDEAGVMVLPPFHSIGDLMSITEHDIQKILQVLIENAGAEYVFVDLPCGLQPMNIWVLKECTTILQVYSDDKVGRARMKLAQQDDYYQDRSIKGMTLEVINKCKAKTNDSIINCVPYSESLQEGCSVNEVQDRNPAFFQSCIGLLQKIR